jgi:hypothetical protein
MSKVLVRNETNVVLYSWPSDCTINVGNDMTEVSLNSVMIYTIDDCDLSNSTLYENVSDVPDDVAGWKYFYDGSAWSVNPDYEQMMNPDDTE